MHRWTIQLRNNKRNVTIAYSNNKQLLRNIKRGDYVEASCTTFEAKKKSDLGSNANHDRVADGAPAKNESIPAFPIKRLQRLQSQLHCRPDEIPRKPGGK